MIPPVLDRISSEYSGRCRRPQPGFAGAHKKTQRRGGISVGCKEDLGQPNDRLDCFEKNLSLIHI